MTAPVRCRQLFPVPPVYIETTFDNAVLSERWEELFMTQTVSVVDAQNELQDLLAEALAGDEVIITERGTPVPHLVPVVAHSKKKRVAGLKIATEVKVVHLKESCVIWSNVLHHE